MKHIGPYSRALLRGAIGDAVDGRSREGRFLRAYEHSLIEHVGSKPSAVQRVLISRAARLALHLELMDRRSLTDFGMSDRDSRRYLSWSNSLSRLLAHVGLAATTQPPPAVSAPCTPQRVTDESAAAAYFRLLHARPDAG